MRTYLCETPCGKQVYATTADLFAEIGYDEYTIDDDVETHQYVFISKERESMIVIEKNYMCKHKFAEHKGDLDHSLLAFDEQEAMLSLDIMQGTNWSDIPMEEYYAWEEMD